MISEQCDVATSVAVSIAINPVYLIFCGIICGRLRLRLFNENGANSRQAGEKRNEKLKNDKDFMRIFYSAMGKRDATINGNISMGARRGDKEKFNLGYSPHVEK